MSGFDVYLHEKDQFWPRQGSSDHGDKVLSDFMISLTGQGTKPDDFLENFQREGGGGIFNPKISVADLGTLNIALFFEHGIGTKESFQGSGYVF